MLEGVTPAAPCYLLPMGGDLEVTGARFAGHAAVFCWSSHAGWSIAG